MIQRKHLNILSLIMIGFLFGWGSSSFRYKHRIPRGQKTEHFKKLGLSKEKLHKVLAIIDEAEKQQKILEVDLDKKKKIFDQTIETNKDEQKLRTAFFEYTKLRGQVAENRFEVMLKVHSHLSLEQIKKLRTFRPPRKKRR